ncbi:MAG: DMT family transporter [Candidatus Woesearchaeota archaeon]|nr:DMT family transporter [Candidatus Woesearchaeota archaeon]
MNYPLGVLFGIIVMISWGLDKICWKKVSSKLDHHTMLLFNYFFMVLFLFIFSAITNNIKWISLNDLLLAAFMGFLGFIAILMFFISFRFTQISLITALTTAYVPIAAILAVFIFKESITLLLLIGTALVFMGIFLLSLKDGKLKIKNWKITLLLAAAISVIWGFTYPFLRILVNSMGAVTASLYFEGFIMLFCLIYFLIRNKNHKFIVKKENTRWLILSGLLGAVGAVFYNFSLDHGLILIASPMASASMIITVLASWLFLKERLTKKQWVYIIVILSGLILISI